MEDFKSKMNIKHIEIEDKKYVEVEVSCRTTNEDEVCSKLFRKMNYVFLCEKNIQFPITTKRTEIIIKGDKYGLKYFNFQSIKELVSEKYDFDSNFKYLLTIEIQYYNDNVIPFLVINIDKITEYPNLISERTFDKIFCEKDEEYDLDIYDFEKKIFFIHNENELLDLIQVNYYDEDLFSNDKLDYLIHNSVNLNTFQDFFKYPIIDLRFDSITGDLEVFNDYLVV